MKETKLKIAIQKSGRLFDDSLKLLKECGIGVKNGINKLKIDAENFPLEIYFLRDDDIPQYVADKVADIGIVGENVLYEKQKDCPIVTHLGFGKCRLSIAVPRDTTYTAVSYLQGKNIATSYPNLVRTFLKKNDITAEIHEISGSVEIAPGIGLADAIADLVSSGSTLLQNGLIEAETILQSQAVLIRNKDLNHEQLAVLERLIFRIQSVQKARNNKYVLLNAPNDSVDTICQLLPGMRSATVLPLAQQGWSSIHSVISEETFWEIIEQLKAAGAEGILIIPIEKMIA